MFLVVSKLFAQLAKTTILVGNKDYEIAFVSRPLVFRFFTSLGFLPNSDTFLTFKLSATLDFFAL